MSHEELIFRLKKKYGLSLFLAEELFNVYERRGEIELIKKKLEKDNVHI